MAEPPLPRAVRHVPLLRDHQIVWVAVSVRRTAVDPEPLAEAEPAASQARRREPSRWIGGEFWR